MSSNEHIDAIREAMENHWTGDDEGYVVVMAHAEALVTEARTASIRSEFVQRLVDRYNEVNREGDADVYLVRDVLGLRDTVEQLTQQLAEAEARSHDLYEGIESALNYYVCCEEYPEAECHHLLDEVTTQLRAHGDWFYDDARPWMQEPDATDRSEHTPEAHNSPESDGRGA